MPTTSSLPSPITGKRECLVSSTSGRNSAGSSSIDTQSICERGIMMSRTVISDTDSTPSIIDSASASNSRRSNAPRSRSISSSRSSGSRVSSADRRSSSEGRVSSLAGVLIARPRRRGRDSRARRAARSRALHALRLGVAVVVVTLQMQHSVDDQVRAVRAQRLPLPRGLVAHHRHAQHDVAGERLRVIVHERQHVRRVVLAAVHRVQRVRPRALPRSAP